MHTPGPWAIDGPISCNDVPYVVVRANINEVNEEEVAVIGDWNGQGDANARLIAAAPDLLEACKALVGPTSSKAMDMGRAAIAKATK